MDSINSIKSRTQSIFYNYLPSTYIKLNFFWWNEIYIDVRRNGLYISTLMCVDETYPYNESDEPMSWTRFSLKSRKKHSQWLKLLEWLTTSNQSASTVDLFILFGFSCFAYVELSTVLLVWSNPNQLNRRSAIQWYLSLWWVFSVSLDCFVYLAIARVQKCIGMSYTWLYGWPPVYFFGFSCFAYVELSTYLLVWSSSNKSNRRSAI